MATSTDPFASDPLAANKKSILYVGGLDEAVDETTLTAAFRPFGDIQQVLIPRDQQQRPRGFAFVQYVDPADASEALENMNEAELFGRVLKINLAKPSTVKGGAVWAGEAADSWYGMQDKTADAVDAEIQHKEATRR